MFLSRGAKSQLGTNLELVLSHLDWLHKICQEQEDLSCKFRAFFFNDSAQQSSHSTAQTVCIAKHNRLLVMSKRQLSFPSKIFPQHIHLILVF